MIKRIIGFLKRVFGRKVGNTESEAALVTAVPEKEITVRTSYISRIRRVLNESGMQPLKGNQQGTWYIRTASFNDAYRLLSRLGWQEGLSCGRKGGHIVYRLVFPSDYGSITLSDTGISRRKDIAVMTFNISGIPDIKEIRFRLKVSDT